MRKPIREFELRNVSPDNFINQAKGLKLMKQRKRQEKTRINMTKHIKDTELYNAIIKTQKAITKQPKRTISDQIQRGFDVATKWKTVTYRELAEQLIMDGYFMPDFSWQQYEEDLRWDLHIDKKVLEQYAEKHNIILKEE